MIVPQYNWQYCWSKLKKKEFENAYYNILSQSDFAFDYSISHVWSYWIPKNFDDIYSYAISSEKLQKNYVT